MESRYHDAMEQARSNQYLWSNCLAPVDVVDLDIVGILAILRRGFGDQLDAVVERDRFGDSLFHLQVEIGLSLGGE